MNALWLLITDSARPELSAVLGGRAGAWKHQAAQDPARRFAGSFGYLVCGRCGDPLTRKGWPGPSGLGARVVMGVTPREVPARVIGLFADDHRLGCPAVAAPAGGALAWPVRAARCFRLGTGGVMMGGELPAPVRRAVRCGSGGAP